ncbi:MAG: four helix bundle protein [Candidatus Omnitrophica bacterium]|nr:four helix bundle protein [Candidatus Omnitrophota bacterium]
MYIARGSLWEAKRWLNRALERKLVKQQKFEELMDIVNNLAPQLNAFITNKQKKKI